MFRKVAITATALAAVAAQTVAAAACGGLVAPNGAIRLTRATTLVDWRDGVEHYMTSFAYQGSAVKDFGWIVPLPAVPDKVEEGGGWTLQRLTRETHPQPRFFATDGAAQAAPVSAAEVLQQVQVKALDITVLRGSGQAIVDWCRDNGFLLTGETRAHLMVYAGGSPIFMAAKYNVARAEATRQLAGDGAPVLITMHTKNLWVPLEVLANGTDEVNADLYLLTDRPVYTSALARSLDESPEGSLIPGAIGFTVPYQRPMNASLFRDLSSDKNMGWVQPGSWLTYLNLTAPASSVSYDLAMNPSGVLHLAPYGTRPDGATVAAPPVARPGGNISLPPGGRTIVTWAILVALYAALLGLLVRLGRAAKRSPGAA